MAEIRALSRVWSSGNNTYGLDHDFGAHKKQKIKTKPDYFYFSHRVKLTVRNFGPLSHDP